MEMKEHLSKKKFCHFFLDSIRHRVQSKAANTGVFWSAFVFPVSNVPAAFGLIVNKAKDDSSVPVYSRLK